MISPLPDERPRQSVANLIGRFEQQGKRQAPPTVPVVPRSSSVSSQIAGDAAKEEVKEKREWPPNSVVSADIKPAATTLFSSSSPSMSKSPVISPQPIPDTAAPADIPTTPTPVSPEPVNPPLSKGKAVPTGKSTSTAGTRRVMASPAKSRSSAFTTLLLSLQLAHHPQRHLSRRLFHNLSGPNILATPLHQILPRHVKPGPFLEQPHRPPHVRSHQLHTISPVTRPKTPSSGLFAPTAASLARSRNAPPPPPPPVKKMTLSSDLSKARMPVSVPSPARVTKSTSAGAPSTPRGQSKLKAGRTPTRPKEGDAQEDVRSSPSVVSEPCGDSDKLVADRVENGHPSGTAAVLDAGSPEETHGHSEVLSEATHDPAAEENVHSDPEAHSEQQAGGYPAEEETHNHEHVTENVPEEEAAGAHEQVHVDARDDTVSEPTEPHVEVIGNGDSVNVEPTVTGNDIEDIVKLLEGGPKPRPQSIVSIPDEEGVITDGD
ncbi:hypothetical protein JVU11DRAFT_4195 [Chiua virens]|nr:hypothetical protein JVU11DRAFT_4195 [Chiua virens]